MWECKKCRESVEDTFDVCWKCGTSMGGIEDPSFRPEPDWAGVGVGAALGVAFGAAVDHLALGLALGTAFGAAADVVSHARQMNTKTPC